MGPARAGRTVPSISAGLIFPISSKARAAGAAAASGGSGGGFRDIFSGMFGGGRGAPAEEGPEPGSDLEYQVNVPFWTAIRGGVMRLNISRHDTCPTCHGQGSLEAPGKCPECNGTGQDNPDRRADEVQCAVPALPRDGKEY